MFTMVIYSINSLFTAANNCFRLFFETLFFLNYIRLTPK